MSRDTELAVTLSTELYQRLVAEANLLEIPLEWLVASLVVDTVDEETLDFGTL